VYNLGLVEVGVFLDVLFFISEFHFLFLLIFILFLLACLYIMCVVGVYDVFFNVCLFADLFCSFISLFPFCIYLLLCYVTILLINFM